MSPIPHTPVFHVGEGGDSYSQLLGSSLGSVLINFMLQKDVLHCFALSLVREVCSYVVLRVNDLRISAIIPKSKNCCPALQGRHAEGVYYPPALTLPNIFRRGKGNFWSLQLGLIGPGHLG